MASGFKVASQYSLSILALAGVSRRIRESRRFTDLLCGSFGFSLT
jgi:hypothetical protein